MHNQRYGKGAPRPSLLSTEARIDRATRFSTRLRELPELAPTPETTILHSDNMGVSYPRISPDADTAKTQMDRTEI
jgi:hypothetical protein